MTRQKVSKKLRFRVLRRDGFRCVYCGASGRDTRLEIDHVTPVAAGGDNSYWNLVTACFDCNNAKRADPARFNVSDYREELRRKNIATEVGFISEHLRSSPQWHGVTGIDAVVEGMFRDPTSFATFLCNFPFIQDPYEVGERHWHETLVGFSGHLASTWMALWNEHHPGEPYPPEGGEAKSS